MQVIMSYYNIYPDTVIDYMVCSVCGTEAFAWLADAFCCLVCGSDNYKHPEYAHTEMASSCNEADIQKELAKQHCDEIRRQFADLHKRHGQLWDGATMTTRERKRKRLLSDDGQRERQ